MRSKRLVSVRTGAALSAAIWPVMAMSQTTQDIRIVSYNTQDDVSTPTPTGALPNLATVLEGVGQEKYVGDNILQLPDIIALQEATSNTTTVLPLTNDLNSYYGTSIFNYSTYQATTSDGNTDGGGPNGLIYNQKTVNLVASVGVGTPESGSNGEFRQVVRYEFQPLADKGTSNGDFYVYDSHYKSGAASTSDDGSTDGALRNGKAQIIRNDEAANLPANAAVLYVGDYNLDGSNEAMYQTLTAVNSPSGVAQGQAWDPLNLTDNYSETWELNNTYKGIMTESDNDLRYRDDLQTMTSNVINDAAGVLDYINNSYHAFGNNGSVNEGGNINTGSNTALNDINGNGTLTSTQVLAAMNNKIGSDHLPVVADYSIVIPSLALTWDDASADNVWDTSSSNWNNGVGNATYSDGSPVTFNDNNGGNYSVTLNTTVSPGSVTVNNSSGNYSISGSGTIAGTAALTMSGSSQLTLGTVNTYTGGTMVTAGTLVVGVTGALPNGSVTITGGMLQLGASTGLAQVTSLSISGNGTLDVNNNHVIINYGSGPDPIGSIAALIASGYNGGAWNGTGIISSAAAVTPGYGLGYADAADAGNPASLASGTIEIKYTLLGDANLDGVVNGIDFGILAANFNKGVTGWDQGDFNYDNIVNGIDFGELAANFNQGATGTAIGTPAYDDPAILAFAAANGLLADVPEPGSLGLCAVAGAWLMRRRRSSVLE